MKKETLKSINPICAKVENFFRLNYNDKYRLFHAPGRINLIGEHTDYNLGYVLPAAIDHSIFFAINKSNNVQFSKIHSIDFNQNLDINHEQISLIKGSWKSYIQACLIILNQADYHIPGINIVIGGSVPVGAGLSSSAALTCGFIFALNEFFKLGLSKVEITKIAQAAEHLIGINCGLMDQFAVLFGKKGHVFRLDCQDLSYQYFPISLQEYEIVLINSNVKHELVDTAYNDRRADCELVLSKLKENFPAISNLRDVNKKMLKDIKGLVTEVQLRRVQYILEENQRVLSTCQALQSGEIEKVGQFLYASHQGLSKDYEVSCPELDLLVELSKQQESILGSRMMGGGFGGCTINLVAKNRQDIIHTIMAKYQKETGIRPDFYSVKTGNGVEEVLVD